MITGPKNPLYSTHWYKKNPINRVMNQGIFEVIANSRENIEVIKAMERVIISKQHGYNYTPSSAYKHYIKKLADKGIIQKVGKL